MISVCMATYNGAKYIGKQIESVLIQLSHDDELIISDDGSTDETLEIIRSFSDTRIKLLHNHKKNTVKSKHQLVTRNFENALKIAEGDFIFLSDQDDIWKNDKVKIFIDSLKDFHVVMSNYDVIDSNGNLKEKQHHKSNPFSESLIQNIFKMPFHGCCMAFRKSVLKLSLPFPNNLVVHDNWIGMLLFIQDKKKINYIDQSLIFYRVHDNNVSGVSSNSLFFKLYYRIIFGCKLYIRILFKK